MAYKLIKNCIKHKGFMEYIYVVAFTCTQGHGHRRTTFADDDHQCLHGFHLDCTYIHDLDSEHTFQSLCVTI